MGDVKRSSKSSRTLVLTRIQGLGMIQNAMWWGRILVFFLVSGTRLLGFPISVSETIEKPIHPWAHQDLMITRVKKRIREKVSEQSMWVDGEFVSEEDMKTELEFKEILRLIVCY